MSFSNTLTFDRALTKIQMEHNLIGQRMSWLLQAQLFLFIPYVTIKYQGKYLNDVVSSNAIVSISFIGLVTSTAIYLGVLAAHAAIYVWKSRCAEPEKILLVSNWFIHFFGEIASAVTGPMLISIWLYIWLNDSQISKSSFDTSTQIFLYVVVPSIVFWGLFVLFGNMKLVARDSMKLVARDSKNED